MQQIMVNLQEDRVGHCIHYTIMIFVPLYLCYLKMFADLESEYEKEAVSQALTQPATFSAQTLYDAIRKVEINRNVLDTAATLQRNGMYFFCR